MNKVNFARIIIGIMLLLFFDTMHFLQKNFDMEKSQLIARHKRETKRYEKIISEKEADINGYKSLERKYSDSIKRIVQNYYRADSYLNVGGIESDSPAYDNIGIYARILEGRGDFDTLLDNTEIFFQKREEFIKVLPDIWPVAKSEFNRISSIFGERISPFGAHKITEHKGIDIMGVYQTKIFATADGIVKENWLWHWTMGRYVIIEHENGITTHYGHLAKSYVRAGNKVKKGQVIGLLGNSGLSTGPHLHYEIRKDDIPLDPINFIHGYYR